MLLTLVLNSWSQAIFLPQPPKWLGGGAAVFISCHFVSFSIPVCSYRSFSAVLFCSHLYVSFLPEALLFNEFSVHFVVWLSSAFLVQLGVFSKSFFKAGMSHGEDWLVLSCCRLCLYFAPEFFCWCPQLGLAYLPDCLSEEILLSRHVISYQSNTQGKYDKLLASVSSTFS